MFDLKECTTCGNLKKSSPTPDGDEICPSCGGDCMDWEGTMSFCLKSIGKKGGEATVKKYGKKHFSEAGKKGMKARWGK